MPREAPHKNQTMRRRRRPVKVGMKPKTSIAKRRFAADADYRVPRVLVLHALENKHVEVFRFFGEHGWCRAEFERYDERTDNVALRYPDDGDDEVCLFQSLMDAKQTSMRASREAEAALTLVGMRV